MKGGDEAALPAGLDGWTYTCIILMCQMYSTYSKQFYVFSRAIISIPQNAKKYLKHNRRVFSLENI